MRVAVLGASAKPARYSYKAIERLRASGHVVFPVNPSLKEVQGIPVFRSLGEIAEPLDTITVYLNAATSQKLKDELLAVSVKRVIFNPGAENPLLAEDLRRRGTEVLFACTLVLLATGRF